MNKSTQTFRFGNRRSRPPQLKRSSSFKKLSRTPRNSVTFETSSEQTSYEYRDYDYLREHFLRIVDDPSQEKAYELLQELNRNYRYEFEYKIMRDVLRKIAGTNDFAFGDTWSHEFEHPSEFAVVPIEMFQDIFKVKFGEHELKIDPVIFCYKEKAFRFFCNGLFSSVQREKMLAYYLTQLGDKYSSVLKESIPYCQFMDYNLIKFGLRRDIEYYFDTDENTPIPFENPFPTNFANKDFLEQLSRKILSAKTDFMVTFFIHFKDHAKAHLICCFAHVIVERENGFMKKDVKITFVDPNGVEVYSLDVVYNLLLMDIRNGLFDEEQEINFSLQEKINYQLNWGGANIYMKGGHCGVISAFVVELGWYIANTLPRKHVRGYFNFIIRSVLYNLYESGTETIQSLLSTYYTAVMGTFFEQSSDGSTTLHERKAAGDLFVFDHATIKLTNNILWENMQDALFIQIIRNECISTFIGIELPKTVVKSNQTQSLPNYIETMQQKKNGVLFFVTQMLFPNNTLQSENFMFFSSMLDGKKQLALDTANNKYFYGNIGSIVNMKHDMPKNWKFVCLSPKRIIDEKRRLAFEKIFYSDFSYMIDNHRTYSKMPLNVVVEKPLFTDVVITRRLSVLELITYNINQNFDEYYSNNRQYIIAMYVIVIFFLLNSLYGYVKDRYGFGFGNEGEIILRELSEKDYPNLIQLGRNADMIIQEAHNVSIKQKKKAFKFFLQNFQHELELTREEISSVQEMLGIN